MYDELVKRLRAQAVYLPEKFSKNADLLDILMKAADAIEELTGFVQEAERDRDEYRERLDKANDAIEELAAYVRQIEDLRKDGYYLQKTKMMTYGQATMTMPLPEPQKEEP